MNAARLLEHLSGQPEKIHDVLESIGCTGISHNPIKNEIRFSREEGTNPTSCVINTDTLHFICFSTQDRGDLFTLVMLKRNCSFPSALRYVAAKLGISGAQLGGRVRLPFGGFWRGLQPSNSEDATVPTHPESILEQYGTVANTLFLADGIALDVQNEFGLGYDPETARITIPERTPEGELAGIMGRSLDANCPHEERWLPVIPCSRSQLLFGYAENYRHIVEADAVVLFESEKAVMQCRSFEVYNTLALCGCHVSKTQARLIRALRLSRVILAFDEGLEESAVRAECEKLLPQNGYFKTQVGYVFDHQNDIIPEYSKMNIADLGEECYSEAIEKKVIWLNGST